MTPKLESALGSWKAAGATPRVAVPMPAPRTSPVIYLIDRPNSPQSYIVAGIPAAPRNTDEEFPIAAFNTNFGGNFTSRINMNLREEKGWSYGVSSAVAGGRGPRMFRITAQVQTDKTKESIQELLKELRDVLTTRPISSAELSRIAEQHDPRAVQPMGIGRIGPQLDGRDRDLRIAGLLLRQLRAADSGGHARRDDRGGHEVDPGAELCVGHRRRSAAYRGGPP